MRTFSAVFALSWLVASPAPAQDGGDQEGMSGKASLGYLATSGNTSTTSTNAALELILGREAWRHEIDLLAIAATTDEVTTAEAYAAAYQARRDSGDRNYFFTTIDWESNRFSSYDSRISESLGYGRRIVRTDDHTLNMQVGVGARQLRLVDGTQESDAIVRSALDYEWSISDTTRFTQELTLESGASNTSLVSATELRARLFGNISLVLSYRIKRNTDVLPGSAKVDRFTAISLEYAF